MIEVRRNGGDFMKEVMQYFEYRSAAAFAVDWKQCTPTDKAQLKAGLADGSLTY